MKKKLAIVLSMVLVFAMLFMTACGSNPLVRDVYLNQLVFLRTDPDRQCFCWFRHDVTSLP